MLVLLLASCDLEHSTSGAKPAWAATFRVASGELTAADLATASWVRVEASRSGTVIAASETSFVSGAATLRIPSSGDVDVKLIGYSDMAKSAVMWVGSGIVHDGEAEPGTDVVTLRGGPGLLDTHPYDSGWNASIGYDTMTDTRDYRIYRIVKIGTQTWMAQNLNYAVDSSWCYGGKTDSCTKYGRLYQWAAAMNVWQHFDSVQLGSSDIGVQGICPSGWHLPSSAEWSLLFSLAGIGGADTESVLKSTAGWGSGSNGVDGLGFRGLPGSGSSADFWSATEMDNLTAKRWALGNGFGVVGSSRKMSGLSVRCVKD